MPILEIKHLTHTYSVGTPFQRNAVEDISFSVEPGEFLGIIGHTGSGKSTLIQHLNGLLRPTEGEILLNGKDIWAEPKKIRAVRFQVGLVFQYPEHQLFEVDVFSDVCFGPRNLGLSRKETELRAFQALRQVGFPEEYFYQSPFDLSGGQKRRVAIAGVLAMKPDVLVLDEPTAGLDPKGRDEILDQIAALKQETGITVVLVSHSMEDIARYVDRIIVMNRGSVLFDDLPGEVFGHVKELEQVGLAAPQVTYILQTLRAKGMAVQTDATTLEEAEREILRALGKSAWEGLC